VSTPPFAMRRVGTAAVAAGALAAALLGPAGATAQGPAVSAPRDVTAETLRLLGRPPRVAAPIGAARALTRKLRASLATAGDGRPALVRLIWQGRVRPARVLVRGLADDSVIGFNLSLRIVPDSALGWRIRKVTRLDVCARGVEPYSHLCL